MIPYHECCMGTVSQYYKSGIYIPQDGAVFYASWGWFSAHIFSAWSIGTPAKEMEWYNSEHEIVGEMEHTSSHMHRASFIVEVTRSHVNRVIFSKFSQAQAVKLHKPVSGR